MHSRSVTDIPESRDTYEVDELSSKLGICRQAIYKGLNEGTIPSIRIGKRFVIPRAAIEEWLRTSGGKLQISA